MMPRSTPLGCFIVSSTELRVLPRTTALTEASPAQIAAVSFTVSLTAAYYMILHDKRSGSMSASLEPGLPHFLSSGVTTAATYQRLACASAQAFIPQLTGLMLAGHELGHPRFVDYSSLI